MRTQLSAVLAAVAARCRDQLAARYRDQLPPKGVWLAPVGPARAAELGRKRRPIGRDQRRTRLLWDQPVAPPGKEGLDKSYTSV